LCGRFPTTLIRLSTKLLAAATEPKSSMRNSHVLAVVCLLPLCGCSQLPAAPPRPRTSPSRAAAEAVALYATNHDGVLDLEELARSPLAGVGMGIDKDKSGTITADEIAEGIRAMQKSNTILLTTTPRFIFKGAPLAGAMVTLDPVPFLGPDYHAVT